MTRVALLGIIFLAACDVGEVPIGGPGGTDGGGSGSGSGSNTPLCSDRNPSPPPKHQHMAGGTDNAGQSCIASGCHLAGALGVQAPAFDLAGTVYKSDGVTPDPGVTIILLDGSGTNVLTDNSLTQSDDGGNFYAYQGSVPASAFPGHAKVSVCPSVDGVMSTLVTPTATPNNNGPNCNGCHILPGGQTGKIVTR